MSFEIITDTSSGLPFSYVKKHGIKMLAYQYLANDRSYETYAETNSDDWIKDFYKLLGGREPISTSCINAEAFTTAFTSVLNKGMDFIYLGMSSGLSVTYQIASEVVEKLRGLYPNRKMYVFDTMSAAGGQALNVDFAVKQRDKGSSIDDVYQWQVENRLKIVHWFTVEDLFFLKRGGRISAATAVAGTILGIRPVLNVSNEGRLVSMDKVRGRKAALDKLVQKFKEQAIEPENNRIYIQHSDCAEDAKYVKNEFKTKCGAKDVEIAFINPVIGVHTGAGTIMIGFYGNHREDPK